MDRRVMLRVAAATLLAGCGDDSPPALRVGEVAFAEEQLVGLRPDARETLADLAALGLAVARGETRELGEPVIERAVERARLARLPLHLAAREQGLAEEELRAAYAADPEWELRVRHVIRTVPRWASAAERQEARATAEEVRRRALAGEDFAALAAELSEEPGAADRGGLLEPGREGSWVDPFWEAALALEPGAVSPVVETEYGYHVLRLEDRRPVPFEEADRGRILEALVSPAEARAAMERWAAAQPPVSLDPPAVLEARRLVAAGIAPDTLVLARGADGAVYTAWDLAVSRAALEYEERAQLEASGDAVFGSWVQADAREAFWAREARELAVEPPPTTREEAAREWTRRVAGWTTPLGVREGVPPEEVARAALRGISGTGQELRLARLGAEGVRPLLRRRYAVSGAAASDLPSAAASSSETRKRESTR